MLTRSEAIDAVRQTLPVDFDVVEDNIIEKHYGWLIFSQTKRYIETKDHRDLAIGSGGTLVEKSSGRLIRLGSAYPPETHLKMYEAGYLDYNDFDLIVTAISSLEQAVSLLAKLRITYVVPEVECGTTWRIPKTYSAEKLRDRLRSLPCRLNLGSAYFNWEALDQMKINPCLEFTLVENTGHRNEI